MWNVQPAASKVYETRNEVVSAVAWAKSLAYAQPLVNSYTTNWKITMLLMGKSTMSMPIFNGKLLVYQRVDV